MTFKVGDKVIRNGHSIKTSHTGIIRDIVKTKSWPYYVEWDNCEEGWHSESELELYFEEKKHMFKVGDKVKLNCFDEDNNIGTVIKDDKSESLPFLVEWEDGSDEWYNESELKLYKEEEKVSTTTTNKQYRTFYVKNCGANNMKRLSKVAQKYGWVDEHEYYSLNCIIFRGDKGRGDRLDYGNNNYGVTADDDALQVGVDEALDILLGIHKRPVKDTVEMKIGEYDVEIKENEHIKFGCTVIQKKQVEEMYRLFKGNKE